jgi:hypothetical protein
VQGEAIDRLIDFHEILDDAEEEEQTEALEFAVAAFHPSPDAKPPKELDALNLSILSDEWAEFFRRTHLASDRPYCDYKTQIAFFVDTLRPSPENIGFGTIAKVFGISGGALSSLYKKQLRGICPHGRPCVLSPEQLFHVEAFVACHFGEGMPVTFAEIATEIEEHFQIEVFPDTLRKIMKRMGWCKVILGKVLEADRASCPPEAIEEHFCTLAGIANGIPAAMMYNVDETGFQQWVDARNQLVVVPIEYESDEIPLPVGRQGRRSSLIVALSAAGDCLRPVVIIGRKTIETELRLVGISQKRVLVVYQEHGFANMGIIDLWGDEVFFPHVYQTRLELGWTGPAILLLDGCSAHYSDHFHEQCSYYGVIPHFLPPHSSDQT